MGVREEWEMQCPSCGSDEGIRVEARVIVALSEDGTEPVNAEHEWDLESCCTCARCEFDGSVGQFSTVLNEEA